MTREDAYKMLIKRIELPENRDRYTECSLRPNRENGDYLIHLHLRLIREYLEILKQRNDEFIANSCDASIRSANQLLNNQGWKNSEESN